MDNSNRFSHKVLPFAIIYCLLSPLAVGAASKEFSVEDLPNPYNVQAVVTNQTVTLNWTWEAPDPRPQFQTFGYEIFKDGAILTTTPKTSFADFNVSVGTHTYKVRVKGTSKDLGKRVTHWSAWSEPVGAKIIQTCGGPPIINLKVEPTRRQYGAIHSLRLHFIGDVKVPTSCTLDAVKYHIDSGRSAERTGPLKIDAQGRFDEFIDAMGPEDETMTGQATFNITVTAKDEVGGASSGIFSIDLEREDPYAPKRSNER